jgi:hypothetical protein
MRLLLVLGMMTFAAPALAKGIKVKPAVVKVKAGGVKAGVKVKTGVHKAGVKVKIK